MLIIEPQRSPRNRRKERGGVEQSDPLNIRHSDILVLMISVSPSRVLKGHTLFSLSLSLFLLPSFPPSLHLSRPSQFIRSSFVRWFLQSDHSLGRRRPRPERLELDGEAHGRLATHLCLTSRGSFLNPNLMFRGAGVNG